MILSAWSKNMSNRFVIAAAIAAVSSVAPAVQLTSQQIPQAAANGSSVTQMSLTASSSPTATALALPNGADILAQAAAKIRAKGSVTESGIIDSSNNALFDGRVFSSSFSWRGRIHQDHSVFRRPAALSQAI